MTPMTGAPALRLPRGRTLPLEGDPLVMGIINVTPDSFSDGGVHQRHEVAVESALRMVSDGAAIIDIGGESTRPGADPVSLQNEMERVIPVIDSIRARSDVVISIDTMKAGVASAAIDAGADMVNDVGALRFDPAMKELVRSRDVPVILMHMRGEPRTMQESPHYENLLGEVKKDLSVWFAEAVSAGIPGEQILIDPGIGFGKTFDHNLELLASLHLFRQIAPVVVGASRKAFIGSITGQPGGPARVAGSLAAVAAAVEAGAAIVRVHDVRETVDFLKVFMAIRKAAS